MNTHVKPLCGESLSFRTIPIPSQHNPGRHSFHWCLKIVRKFGNLSSQKIVKDPKYIFMNKTHLCHSTFFSFFWMRYISSGCLPLYAGLKISWTGNPGLHWTGFLKFRQGAQRHTVWYTQVNTLMKLCDDEILVSLEKLFISSTAVYVWHYIVAALLQYIWHYIV